MKQLKKVFVNLFLLLILTDIVKLAELELKQQKQQNPV